MARAGEVPAGLRTAGTSLPVLAAARATFSAPRLAAPTLPEPYVRLESASLRENFAWACLVSMDNKRRSNLWSAYRNINCHFNRNYWSTNYR